MVELESTDVQHGVDPKLRREIQLVGIVVDDSFDLERAEVLEGELRGSPLRPEELEVFGRKQHLVSNLELNLPAMLVSVASLAVLSLLDAPLCTLQIGTKALDAVVGLGVLPVEEGSCEGSVDGELHLLARVQVERREPRRGVLGVVDCEFGRVEVFIPIRLLEIDVGPEELLQGSVGPLGLAVGLRVVSGTHGQGGSELGPECTPKVGGEARVTIAEDRFRHPVQPNHLAEEDPCKLRGCH